MGGFAGFTQGLLGGKGGQDAKKPASAPAPSGTTPSPQPTPLPANLTGAEHAPVKWNGPQGVAGMLWDKYQTHHHANQAVENLKSKMPMGADDQKAAYAAIHAAHGPKSAQFLQMHGVEVPPQFMPTPQPAALPANITNTPAPSVPVQGTPQPLSIQQPQPNSGHIAVDMTNGTYGMPAPPAQPHPRMANTLGLGETGGQ